MTRKTLVAFLMVVPSPLVWAQEPARGVEVLTLEQAGALAVKSNRSIQSAALQVRRSEEKVGAARRTASPLSASRPWPAG